jgi:hypothetical protein
MSTDDDAEAMRRRMAELRRELTFDVRDVGRSARAMANPAFYLRKFPWATTAVAALVGYMLVPKKKEVVKPDPEVLAELVRKNQVKLDTSAASKDTQGMLKSLVVMGITYAAKVGFNHIVQQLTTAQAEKSRAAETESSDSASSPSAAAEESWKAK